MPRRLMIVIVLLALSLPTTLPSSADAFEFFHRRHYSSSSPAVVRYQQAERWYPDYRPLAGDSYGGGVQTYAYGYFGARVHSSNGWHHGYYGDCYMWGPLRGR
jgi:hypothetical protein